MRVNLLKMFDDNGDKLFVAAFPVRELKDPVRSLFIRYVERKLILEYALRGVSPPSVTRSKLLS